MRSVLAYTAARLLLFAVAFGVLYLLGARGLLAAALAVLISGMVSYVLLSRQRDAMSGVIARGIGSMRGLGARLETGAAKEDAAQRAAAAAGTTGAADPEAEPQDGARADSAESQDVPDGAAGPEGADGLDDADGGQQGPLPGGSPQEAR
ncbi:hypothetical protein GCM10027570_11810 [Streptomonospora sediminis]